MASAESDSEYQGRTQSSTRPIDSAPSQAPAKAAYFPLGYKDGFNQWWAGLPPATTEHRVLSFIPYLQKPPTQTGSAPTSATTSTADVTELTTTNSITDPYGPRRWLSNLVQLKGKNRFLNEFSVERVDEEVDNNLVMLHGYGAGLGFFYRNFEPLSRMAGWRLYALDMLGMGRSARPPFKIHAKSREDKISEAENWFIDALEEWRIKKGIDRFTLLGHSMGGYLAVAYALKYPGHLKKLILASPVGIPEDPLAVSAAMPEPSDSTMANEFTQDAATESKSVAKPPRKPLPKWLTTLWDANISPFSFVRWSGPLGPRLVSGWTTRRFSHLPSEEAQALHDYSYSLFRQRGSGEYALAYILAPGAFARSPLIRRIQGVGRQWLEPHSAPVPDSASTSAPSVKADSTTETMVQRVRECGIPVVLMYGENDWMDVNGGRAAAKKIEEEKQKVLANASDAEKARENGDAKVVVIRKAGHHVYLDGADHFNSVMEEEMKDVEARERRLGYSKA